MAPHRPVGPVLGKALRDLFVDGFVAAKAGILPHENSERVKANLGTFDHLESQLAPLTKAWTADILANPDLPDGLRGALTEMQEPEHAIGFLLQTLGWIGYLMGAISQLGAIASRGVAYDMNAETLNVPLTPADAADAVMRSLLTETEGAVEAAQAGVGPETFGLMVNLVGEPPGIIDMLSLWRRGVMDWGTFQEMVAYSRVKTTYATWYKILAYSYMSPADVIELCVKGVITPELAKTMFAKAGGKATQFTQLYLGAGDAIGVEKVMTLWNHGLATENEVDATLGRSRINPVFYSLAKQQRHHFLSAYQIGQCLTKGLVDAPTATTWLLQLGLPATQAAAYAQAGATTKSSTAKAETEAMVIQLYTDLVVTAQQAEEMLVNLGYTAEVAGILIELADAKRALRQQSSAVSAVRAAFLAGHITATTAGIDLDELEIPPDAKAAWLQDWAVEKSARLKVLTVAQIGTAAKKGVITYDTAFNRYVEMGYSTTDAEVLVGYYGGPPPATSPAALATTSAA